MDYPTYLSTHGLQDNPGSKFMFQLDQKNQSPRVQAPAKDPNQAALDLIAATEHPASGGIRPMGNRSGGAAPSVTTETKLGRGSAVNAPAPFVSGQAAPGAEMTRGPDGRPVPTKTLGVNSAYDDSLAASMAQRNGATYKAAFSQAEKNRAAGHATPLDLAILKTVGAVAKPAVPVAQAVGKIPEEPKPIPLTEDQAREQSMPLQPPPPPPVLSESSGPGIDWNKVGEIAKATGKSILGVLQAAVAGRTAGLQGRALDFANETLSGREQAATQERQALQDQFDVQAKLKAIDQGFAAKQQAIQDQLRVDLAKAATEEDKAKAQAEFAQRMKELQVTGQQAMDRARVAAGGAPVAAGGGQDPGMLRQFLPGGAR